MTARRPSKLPRWHEWAIYLGFGALFATGVAWLLLDRWVRISGEFGPEHHPAQQIMLIVHGIAAYLLLIVAGALIPVHVKVGWSIRRNLKSGVGLAAVLAILSLTALGLYYVSADNVRSWSSIAHWSVGIVALPVLLLHVVQGRRGPTPQRARSPRRRGRPRPAG